MRRNLNNLEPADVKLAIIGAPNVGKSALTVRFLTRRYIGEYESSVESTYRREINLGNNDLVTYDVRDCVGQFCVNEPDTFMSWAHALAIVYSVDDRKSFQAAEDLLDDIRQIDRTSSTSAVLLGNKKDLTHSREVTSSEGQELAQKYSIGFYEVSASIDFENVCLPLSEVLIEAYMKGNRLDPNNNNKQGALLNVNTDDEAPRSPTPTGKQRSRSNKRPERKGSVRRKLSQVIFKRRSDTL